MSLTLFDAASRINLSQVKAMLPPDGSDLWFRELADAQRLSDILRELVDAAWSDRSAFGVYWQSGLVVIGGADIPPGVIAAQVALVDFRLDPPVVDRGRVPENVWPMDPALESEPIDATCADGSVEDAGPKASEPELSEEQKSAVDAIIAASKVREGGITYVTGKAGTGKSTVSRAAAKVVNPIILAPTALAAYNVGGQTIHSFFGFEQGPLSAGRGRALKGEKGDMLRRCGAIFIDEFGMVRPDILDAIDRSLRRTPMLDESKPFGGVPIVGFGDLFQIEPIVGRGGDEDFIKQNYQSHFFFDSHVAQSSNLDVHRLQTVFRQSGDPSLVDALNLIRVGDLSGLEYFNQFVREQAEGAVQICYKNDTVARVNAAHLSMLDGDSFSSVADHDPLLTEKEMPGDRILRLKIGARVMFTKNADSFYNGECGTVRDCREDAEYLDAKGVLRKGLIVEVEKDSGVRVVVSPMTWEQSEYEFDSETNEVTTKSIKRFTQLPLKLAYAITCHKSQGMTLDAAHILLDVPAFAHGLLYVALSRVRSAAGLSIARPLTKRDLVVNPCVRAFEAML